VSSTCFEHPNVHHQEDLYMLFCGISFMHPYKQSGRRWTFGCSKCIEDTITKLQH